MSSMAQPAWQKVSNRMTILRLSLGLLLILSLNLPGATAQKPYGDAVVAKADQILKEIELRRSGKVIQMTGNATITRALSSLTKEKRELRKLRDEWQQVVDQLTFVRNEIERLNVQYGELNLQLARVVNNTTANNQLVALINATSAKMKTLAAQRERLKGTIAEKRGDVNTAEVNYTETVLAIRDDFSSTREQLVASLEDDEVQIALQVMHRNFETPQVVTADLILASLDKRIGKIESEIFQEAVPLQARGGSLFADVVVGNKKTKMVVDSGATMISLPMRVAGELGVKIPADARELQLVLADGRSIPAHAVTLPRVRVGRFEVENVDAAVLAAVADDAEPLLGMSFLGNFKFELDAGEKTLKLLSVED
jgi:aspartyl protease family protein